MVGSNRTRGKLERHHPVTIVRLGLAVSQAAIGLFAAGSVLFGAHSLFLRYYAREWSGMQIAGVNECQGEDWIANGDLLEGKTFCNKPINYMPWLELYHRHWQAALMYYGAILITLILIGWVFLLMQRQLASATPFGTSAPVPSPADSEHLR